MIIPLSQWRILVAAAVVLLLVNFAVIFYYGFTSISPDQTYALVSDYQLYEQ